MTGLEPVTSSLPRTCSTYWATWAVVWSGKRDSNPRPSAWKADALANWAIPASSTNLKIQDGEGRIRTSEGWADRFTVCSLWPLGNLPEILGKTRPLKPVKHLTLNLQRRTLESPFQLFKTGAGKGTRTPDLLITNQLLYQLSYASSANKKPPLYTLISKAATLFGGFWLLNLELKGYFLLWKGDYRSTEPDPLFFTQKKARNKLAILA